MSFIQHEVTLEGWCRSDGLPYPPLSLEIYLIFHSLPKHFSSVEEKTAIGSLTVLQKIKTCSWSDLLDVS